jgi:enoyl-CoA hydratase/carnithine racemase
MADYVELTFPYEGVAQVTLCDPGRQNNICWQTAGELADALEKARADGARVAVLASSLEGHWFEHAWLTDLTDGFEGKPVTGEGPDWFRTMGELNKTDLVTIAAISGDTSGGGCEFGWACDLRVAEEQVLFSQPEVLIGVGTGIGGTSRLLRLIGRTATAEMVLDGCQMTAQRIYDLGGINRVVNKGEALDHCLNWAKRMAGYPEDALVMMKRMLTQSEDLFLNDAIMNDQKIFQSQSNTEFSRANMRRIQAVYDSGVPIREAIKNEYGD